MAMDDIDDQLCFKVDVFEAFPKKWWDAWGKRENYFTEYHAEI